MQYFNFDSMPKIVTYAKTLIIINSAYSTINKSGNKCLGTQESTPEYIVTCNN